MKPMRIAYVSLHWPRIRTSGIGKKIDRQTTTWRQMGHEVQFFCHMHETDENDLLVDGRHFRYSIHQGTSGLLKTERSRMAAMKQLIQAVHAWQPDVIFLRWGMYVHPLRKLFRIAPVVVEINTNDVEEHKLLGPVKSTYNRLTRGITLGGARGIVYATRELAKADIFTSFNKPGIVISNSIDLQSIPVLPAPKNSSPHLVFIGTPGFAWHGVEKLVTLAQALPDVVIDLIGYDHLEGFDHVPQNLILHGYLSGQAFLDVMAQADGAIGTLALHRKGMNEASPLKIRDCAARGIPCILPYKDTDFDDLDSDLFLRIPNREDNVQTHSREIHDFAYRVQGKRIPRELIQERIDSQKKEAMRLAFLEKMCKSDSRGF